MIHSYQGVTQTADLAMTTKSQPSSSGWTISTTASSGGRQRLTVWCAGATLMVFDLTTAEAAALGTALGGTGGAPVASMVGQ